MPILLQLLDIAVQGGFFMTSPSCYTASSHLEAGVDLEGSDGAETSCHVMSCMNANHEISVAIAEIS